MERPINQRIKFLLDTFKLSARDFSRALGVPDNNTQNYLEPRFAQPKADYLERILLHFESINPVWLLTGKGEPLIGPPGSHLVNSTVSGEKNTVTNIGQSLGAVNIGRIDLDECKGQLAAALMKIDYLEGKQNDLTQVIAAKDALIASKDETLALWRIAHNRPN